VILPALLLIGALGFRALCLALLPEPGTRLFADYCLGAAWGGLLGAGLLLWPASKDERRALFAIWSAKLFVTLAPMLVYEHRYWEDHYFLTALFDRRKFDTFTEFVRLHLLLTPNSFHAAKVGFSMLGLAGIFLIYRASVLVRGKDDSRLLLLLGFFPSILFWSSAPGKEPMSVLAIGLFLYGLVRLEKGDRFGGLLAALAVALHTLIRPWMAFIMGAAALAFAFAGRKPAWMKAGLALALAALGVTAMGAVVPSFERFFEAHDAAVRTFAEGGSSLPAPSSEPGDILAAVPAGTFRALFRPLPGEVRNPLGHLTGVENLILLLLCLRALGRFRREDLRSTSVSAALVLVLAWAAAYGVVAYNHGAMARYKVAILPPLLLLLLYLGRSKSTATGSRENVSGL
jgi:hypothetical protein